MICLGHCVVALLLYVGFVTAGAGLYLPQQGRKTHLVSHRNPRVSQTLYSYNNNLENFYRWSDIYQTGLWLYYSGDYYRGSDVTAILGTDLQYTLQHTLASVRYAGNSRSLHLPSLTLYSQTWFRGLEYNVEVPEWRKSGKKSVAIIPDFRDFGKRAQSAIVTGGEWALFQLPNLEGECRCLIPSMYHHTPDANEGTIGVYEAGLFPFLNITRLTSFGSAIASCGFPVAGLCPPVTWPKQHTRCSVVTKSQVVDPCSTKPSN